jgi:hypothetical protein
MAALPNTQPAVDAVHRYHAKAFVLSGSLAQPIEREIEEQAQVSIDQESNGKRVYEYQSAKSYQVEGIISYQSGYTQVAGHKSPKPGHGFVTLATSVMEGLNILDVVTADRVVGQISTEHPLYPTGQVPSVTFLGTRFVNLRIGGHKVEVEPDLHILGPKPDGDRSYLKDQGVLSRIARQFHNISGAVDAPDWAREEYRWDPSMMQSKNEAKCSLVSRVTGLPAGNSFGHVIDLPHFGRVFLGELIVNRTAATKKDENDTYRFNLSMVRVEMGCLAQGTATAAALDSNGTGKGKTGP